MGLVPEIERDKMGENRSKIVQKNKNEEKMGEHSGQMTKEIIFTQPHIFNPTFPYVFPLDG